jgi:TatD DNase family protein
MIDCHCHITHIKDIEEVLEEAEKREMILINSALNVEETEISFEIQNRHKFFYVCVGLHPTDIDKLTDENIEEYFEYMRLNKEKFVAIGEAGLDFYWVKKPEKQKRQKQIFRKIIKLAKELKKPLVIHSRNSMRETLDMLKDEGAEKVMLHCFSGNEATLKTALDSGYYISYATNILWTKKHPFLIKETPLDKMFLETDSPWLDPDTTHEDMKDKDRKLNNRPWKIEKSALKISGIKNITAKEVLEKTRENAVKFFNL